MNRTPHIAVIGAGIAGTACASALQSAGFEVSLFDKSRGPGGRMSTRRGDGWQCDHGAQYFTARAPAFRAEVARWEAAGVAAKWHAQVRSFGGDHAAGGAEAGGATERFVGAPRMSSVAAWLASSLALSCGVTISGLQRDAAGWSLLVQDGHALGEAYDMVVLAVPAPQAAPLLRKVAPHQAALAEQVRMAGCWSLMLDYDAPLALNFEAAFINQGPMRWVARDSSKPGRTGRESWLLHASAEWSEEHIERDGDEVAAMLLEAFARWGGPAPQRWSAHRWRYASTPQARDEVCLWEPAQGLGVCGDWLNGGTVEAAWLSGQALAQRIIAAQA
jgi:predicted NAD/FAD-dependent oxidoreductase